MKHPRLFGTLSLLALAASSACGGGDPSAPAEPAPDGPACLEGESPTDDACEPVLPAADCPAGTRASIGRAACVPVGPGACPDGFSPRADGWGCRPTIASARCKGATRESLGSASCVPVGDCDAPFPPPEATLFVDASFTAGQVDATHKKTLADAIAAASAGATIAVEAGVYAEALRIRKDVSIVGRCADKTVLDGGATKSPALEVFGAKLGLRAVTVRRGDVGLYVEAARAEAAVESVVFDANVRAGIEAFDAAKVAAKDVVIRATTPAGDSSITNGIFADVESEVRLENGVIDGASDYGVGATGGSKITLVRSVVRRPIPRPDGVGGGGARAFEKGLIELQESALVACHGSALLVGRTKGAAKLVRSSIVDTELDLRPGIIGSTAVSVTDGASVEIDGSTVADNIVAAIAVGKGGSAAKITDSAIVATRAGGPAGAGTAIGVNGAGSVEVSGSAIVDSAFIAVQLGGDGARLTMDGSLVASVHGASGSLRIPEGQGGNAIVLTEGATGVVTDVTVEGARESAIAVGVEGSALSLERVLVRGTRASERGMFGHGVLAILGGELRLSRSVIEGSEAVGVVFSEGTGALDRSVVRSNAIGIHVQDGSSLLEVDEVPDELDPGTVLVTKDSLFRDNGARVGSGEVPIPSVAQ